MADHYGVSNNFHSLTSLKPFENSPTSPSRGLLHYTLETQPATTYSNLHLTGFHA